MKKAELSLQIVVVAIVSLLVLVVLIAIFTTNVGQFSGNLKDCQGTYKGVCKAECDSSNEVSVNKPTNCNKIKIDKTKTQICCKPLDYEQK